jgi:hypothetical protein
MGRGGLLLWSAGFRIIEEVGCCVWAGGWGFSTHGLQLFEHVRLVTELHAISPPQF